MLGSPGLIFFQLTGLGSCGVGEFGLYTMSFSQVMLYYGDYCIAFVYIFCTLYVCG